MAHARYPLLVDLLILCRGRGDGTTTALLIEGVEEEGRDQTADDDDISQQELDQAFEGLREAGDRCANGGKRGLNDAEDGIDDGLEDGEDGTEDCGDRVEDGGDQIAELINERRHVCGCARLEGCQRWSERLEGKWAPTSPIVCLCCVYLCRFPDVRSLLGKSERR